MLITVDLTGIEAVRAQFAKLGKMPQLALDRTAVAVEDYIQDQLGKHAKPGAMEQSLGKVRISNGWEIGHDLRRAPYARFVHDGTGLWGYKHMKFKIAPIQGGIYKSYKDADGKTVKKGIAKGGRGRTMLRWAGGGVFHFAPFVMHPGNKPDKWMDRAAAKAPDIFRKHLDQLITQT